MKEKPCRRNSDMKKTGEILRVENLTKIYGEGENAVRALDGVSFSVQKIISCLSTIKSFLVILKVADRTRCAPRS